jgi:hypothetical protein
MPWENSAILEYLQMLLLQPNDPKMQFDALLLNQSIELIQKNHEYRNKILETQRKSRKIKLINSVLRRSIQMRKKRSWKIKNNLRKKNASKT